MPIYDEAYVKRFWSHVKKTSGCWEWQMYKSRTTGYGVVSTNRDGSRLAHRVAWELSNGKAVPAGLYVCHHCDNRACVRPSHLFVGTAFDNAQDARNKGRLVHGPEWHLRHRFSWKGRRNFALTPRDVRIVRRLWKNRHKGWTQSAIAARFGVTQPYISRIVNGLQRKAA